MKKSTRTPKQLMKKRVANNKQIKVAREQCSLEHSEKEIEPFKVNNHDYKRKFYKARDRELKEDSYPLYPHAVPERLRVTTQCRPPRKEKPVPFMMGEIHTVCDIDPAFYKIIEGRPVRSFYDIKTYMKNIRDITIFRANAGYLKEQIIQKETDMVLEYEEYERICHLFTDTKENFRIFAEESYNQAKRMQQLAEEKAQELADVTDKLNGYSFEFNRLNNEFATVVASYEKLTRYKNFLNNLSPIWWRQRYEGICELGTNLCSNLFSQLQSEETETVTLYKKNTLSLAQLKPQMYFRRPWELTSILDYAGRQCLNYMEIDAYFSASLAKVNKYRKYANDILIAKSTDMQDIIEYIMKKIKVMEERRDAYQTEFEKVLEKEFCKLVASYDSTKLFMCLQFVHTRIFGDKEDPKDTLTTLTYDLERFYWKLSKNLEGLNQEVVKSAAKQMFDGDKKIMRHAHEAHRHLKEYDVLCQSLYRSFEPPRRKTRC